MFVYIALLRVYKVSKKG